MANILDADRKLAVQIEAWRDFAPDLIPVARKGRFLGFFAADLALGMLPPAPMPIADFVLGLELLGFRFYVADDQRGKGLYIMEPAELIPPEWDQWSLALMGARGSGRTGEVIDYLLERDEGPKLERRRVNQGEAPNAA